MYSERCQILLTQIDNVVRTNGEKKSELRASLEDLKMTLNGIEPKKKKQVAKLLGAFVDEIAKKKK